MPVILPTGDLVKYPTLTIDGSVLKVALEWIARGLNYHHRKFVVPEDAEIEVWTYDESGRTSFQDVSRMSGFNGPFQIGHCFKYAVLIVDDRPTFSNWLFLFYDLVHFAVAIEDRALHDVHK
ncbi:MAG: hypothetical protein IT207_11620 [Fimbriimonadaceae bacterium]|nr:hypothetical protein [Fimbriimonadaceae bacterium]